MRRVLWAICGVAGATVLLASACTSGSMNADEIASLPPGPGGAGSSGSDHQADAAAEGSLRPEQEVESAYEFPAATGHYVWVANPVSGRVAYIDATTLQVRTTQAGNGPTYLAAIPDDNIDTAIVINVLSNEATLLKADAAGNIDSVNVPVAAGSNSWAIEPAARWAIAWTDYRRVQTPRTTDGFQDISVVALSSGEVRSTRLTVGYRPVAIRFSLDAKRAWAVTQDGVSVLDLAAPSGPTTSGFVSISDDPMDDPGTRDVVVTPDGSYALVRRDGSADITLIDLTNSTRKSLTLPGSVTDLDLSPDGTRAIAVVRDTSDAVILPLPAVATDPTAVKIVPVDDAVVGSVSMAQKASVALLYSNASEQQRVTKLAYGSDPPEVRTLKLHAPVLATFLAPLGTSAIILHGPILADGGTGGSSAPGAFSLLNIDPELPARLQGMQAPPMGVAIGNSASRAIVGERDDQAKVYGAWLVRVATQQVDRYALASPPLAVGILEAANRAYVAQKHSEGRVTFVDLDTGLARTLTGFELAARVVDGTGQQ
jgi:DNA-binding beta-propeller fold protein YncE